MSLPLPLRLPRTTQARPQRAVALSHAHHAFGMAWAALAILSLAFGLAWRASGTPPGLVTLLGLLSAMLYLSALIVAPGYAQTLAAQCRYTSPPGARLTLGARCAWEFAWRGLLLALAPAGALLAYRGAALTAQLTYNGQVELTLSQAGLVLYCLVVIGGAVTAASTALLLLLRRLLGASYGVVAWLAVGAAMHCQFLGVTPGPHWRVSLGSYGAWALSKLQEWQASPVFIQDLYEYLGLHLGQLVLIWAGVLAALMLVQPMSGVRRGRVSALWLASTFSVLISAVQSALAAHTWAANPLPAGPGPWLDPFYTGLVALWLPLLALGLAGALEHRFKWWEYLWPLAAALGWLALTQAHVVADQAGRLELIRAAGLALLIAYAGLVALLWVNRAAPAGFGWRIALYGALALLLLVPLGESNLPVGLDLLNMLRDGFIDPLRRPESVVLCAVLGAMILLLWPWPRGRASSFQLLASRKTR